MCDKHIVQQEHGTSVALVESLAIIPGCFAQELTESESALSNLTGVDLQREQRADVTMNLVITHLEECQMLCWLVGYECPHIPLLLRE